jgi:hypothetical protein
VLLDLVFSWRHAPFRYFTSDTYYYLNVARNAAETGLPSFDGERPTNGFHPLWQLLLVLLTGAWRVLGLDELSLCYAILVVNVCLATLAVVVIGWTIRRARGAVPVSFLLLPVGLYALLVAPVWIRALQAPQSLSPAEGPFPLYGTIWSFVNGMESSLALLGFAVLGLLVTRAARPSTAFAALVGATGALVVLARLDQVFIAVSVLALLAFRWLREAGGRSVPRILAMGAAFAAPIALYLLGNFLYCGLAFPVSGATKLSFSGIGRSNLQSLRVVLSSPIGTVYWLDRFFRLAQLLIPAAAAASFLLASVRLVRTPGGPVLRPRRGDDYSSFLIATAAGVLALTTFVFLFTDASAYGSWSLPVPVLFVTLAVLGILPERTPAARPAALLACGCTCVALAVFWTLHRQPEYHEKYRRFFAIRDEVVAFYGGRAPRIVEFDDGVVGFATHFHTLSGLNLATDKELHRAIPEGRLLPVARQRGYDRIASVVYIPPPLDRASVLRFLATRYPDGPGGRVRYALEYLDPAVPFAIAKMTWEEGR